MMKIAARHWAMYHSPNFRPELINLLSHFVLTVFVFTAMHFGSFCILVIFTVVHFGSFGSLCILLTFTTVQFWQFFLLHIIFTAVQWVLMISPRVNVWVTTIIWRYNIHCSTHHIKEKEKRKRVMREVWRHSVCRRAAIYTQYISLFNQFFD